MSDNYSPIPEQKIFLHQLFRFSLVQFFAFPVFSVTYSVAVRIQCQLSLFYTNFPLMIKISRLQL